MSAPATNTKLSVFIEACLEPLPDDVLIDTQYNSMIRKQRHAQWHKEYYRYATLKGLLEAATYKWGECAYLFSAPIFLPPRDQVLKCYREALANLLLTPAVRKGDVDWKKRQINDLKYVPVDPTEVEAAIVADEAFLAAHPTKRTHRKVGQGVQPDLERERDRR